MGSSQLKNTIIRADSDDRGTCHELTEPQQRPGNARLLAIVVVARGACGRFTERVGSANMRHDGAAKRRLSWAWMGRDAMSGCDPREDNHACALQSQCTGVPHEAPSKSRRRLRWHVGMHKEGRSYSSKLDCLRKDEALTTSVVPMVFPPGPTRIQAESYALLSEDAEQFGRTASNVAHRNQP